MFFLFSSYSNAKNIQAYLSYASFKSFQQGSYIETYLAISANSIKLVKNTEGKFQGNLEITLIFKKDTTVKAFKKYNLLSPALDDTNSVSFNLIDQQRFSLPNGQYNFEIFIKDNNDKNSHIKTTEQINIDFPQDKISISDIEFVASYKSVAEPTLYSKNGYDLAPYIFDYYPPKTEKIIFYSEIYNTDKVLGVNQQYLLNYYIQVYETNKKISEYNIIKKQNTGELNVILNEYPIQSLPSGNYNLVVDVINRNNEIVATKKIFFQRNNPSVQINFQDIAALNTGSSFVKKYENADTLFDFLKSLRPISTDLERNFFDNNFKNKDNDLKLMQQYFLRFWESRNQLNPEKAWLTYFEEVKKVNAAYSSRIRKGYETDRGRVYLQYGPPNTITTSDKEPSAYPYEIWHYYKIKNQSNRKFVFYNPDLVTNDYALLHSDATGEVNNYNWNLILNNRNDRSIRNIDDKNADDQWGGKSLDYFNLPH
jgi:GWxTD domain-containing protein